MEKSLEELCTIELSLKEAKLVNISVQSVTKIKQLIGLKPKMENGNLYVGLAIIL